VAVSTVGLESARAGHVADETRSTNPAMCAASRTPALRDTSPSVPRPPAVPEKHALTAPESFVIPPQSKMLKCADNEDIITMKADDAGDVVTFMFESPGTSSIARRTSRATRDPEPGRRSRHRTRRFFKLHHQLQVRTTRVFAETCGESWHTETTKTVPRLAFRARGADRRGTHRLTPC
jgi:hypothetical protein